VKYCCFNGEAFLRFDFIQYGRHAFSYVLVQVTVNALLVRVKLLRAVNQNPNSYSCLCERSLTMTLSSSVKHYMASSNNTINITIPAPTAATTNVYYNNSNNNNNYYYYYCYIPLSSLSPMSEDVSSSSSLRTVDSSWRTISLNRPSTPDSRRDLYRTPGHSNHTQLLNLLRPLAK